MDDEDLQEESQELGSDELLSDDNLRLPDSANMLVRLHAIRAWLTRRQKETNLEIGNAALVIQDLAGQEQQSYRLRRRELQALTEQIEQAQQKLQQAQQRLHTYEEAEALLEDCVAHTTTGERSLVEYYLTIDDILQTTQEQDADNTARIDALLDVQSRVGHVGSPQEET